jgi:hypothetical protein
MPSLAIAGGQVVARRCRVSKKEERSGRRILRRKGKHGGTTSPLANEFLNKISCRRGLVLSYPLLGTETCQAQVDAPADLNMWFRFPAD